MRKTAWTWGHWPWRMAVGHHVMVHGAIFQFVFFFTTITSIALVWFVDASVLDTAGRTPVQRNAWNTEHTHTHTHLFDQTCYLLHDRPVCLRVHHAFCRVNNFHVMTAWPRGQVTMAVSDVYRFRLLAKIEHCCCHSSVQKYVTFGHSKKKHD